MKKYNQFISETIYNDSNTQLKYKVGDYIKMNKNFYNGFDDAIVKVIHITIINDSYEGEITHSDNEEYVGSVIDFYNDDVYQKITKEEAEAYIASKKYNL